MTVRWLLTGAAATLGYFPMMHPSSSCWSISTFLALSVFGFTVRFFFILEFDDLLLHAAGSYGREWGFLCETHASEGVEQGVAGRSV